MHMADLPCFAALAGVYHGWPKMQLRCTSDALFCNDRQQQTPPDAPMSPPLAAGSRRQRAAYAMASEPDAPGADAARDGTTRRGSADATAGSGRVHCDGDGGGGTTAASRLFLAVGATSASSAVGRLRRRASRQTWARTDASVLVCFLLSTRGPAEQVASLRREAGRQQDLLLLDVRESATLTPQQARLAGFHHIRHGHCVFKNWAWFRHAAASWPRVPWVAKVDDDTLVNLPPMLSLLRSLGCHSQVFLGPMQWTSWLSSLPAIGIRSLPCGYSTGGLLGALKFLSRPLTTLFNAAPSVMQPCDALGAAPPFPFALGGGYVFSGPLLRRLANSTAVAEWVDAASVARPAVDPQVIFFSDTTVGLWLSLLLAEGGRTDTRTGTSTGTGTGTGTSVSRYHEHPIQTVGAAGGAVGGATEPIVYVDIGAWAHDHCCPPPASARRATRRKQPAWRCGPVNSRPASPNSLLIHSLKQGGFAYAFERSGMRAGRALGYEYERCIRDVFDPSQTQSHSI